jgi:hypothetical protein
MNKYTIILFFLITSCIEPIEVNIQGEGSNLLVLEGGITTGLGPHTIELTRTAKYGSIFDGVIKRESGALVSVRDSNGEITFLSEENDGVYQTEPTFRGEVGKSYILQIETTDGDKFNSIPESIVSVPEIETLYGVYDERPTENPLKLATGLQVYVDYTDDVDVDNYYLWSVIGTFQINANPELKRDMFGGLAPLDCCETCWAEESNTFPNITNDNTFNGTFTTQPITFIQDDGVRIEDKYFIEVEQLSLSAEAFEFYELVNQQLSISGDIFDPPPATIRGNMINLNNPDQNVIGYFTASDVRKSSIFLFPNELVNKQGKSLIADDCRAYKNNATTVTPSFW